MDRFGWLCPISLWCLALGLVPLRAAAFCRTSTCLQTTPPPQCGKQPAGTCETEGEFLILPNACISFSVDEAGSLAEGISADQLEELVREIFDNWQSVDCGGGQTPSLRVDTYPRATCSEIGFSLTGRNQNVWTFVDSGWLAKGKSHTATALALTTVQFDGKTGRIYGADVELNSELFDFTLEALDYSRHDLRGIVQHESGHYFGLAHSFVAGATMQTYANRPDEMAIRTLDPDDIAGICSIYPPGTDLSGRSSEPLGGFSPTCNPDPETDACCAIAPGRPTSRRRGGWLMLAATICYALRRSKLVQPIVQARSVTRKQQQTAC